MSSSCFIKSNVKIPLWDCSHVLSVKSLLKKMKNYTVKLHPVDISSITFDPGR